MQVNSDYGKCQLALMKGLKKKCENLRALAMVRAGGLLDP